MELSKDVARRIQNMSGNDFEKLCCDLINELGFINLRRQASGTQFGCDITAEFKHRGKLERWVFECKKYSTIVPLKEVSNKILWADKTPNLKCFVIISNSELANDVHNLLDGHRRKYYLLAWTGTVFSRLLLSCSKTYSNWFPNCPQQNAISPKRFLKEERSRFKNEPSLCKLIKPGDDTFNLRIVMDDTVPTSSYFYVTAYDSRDRIITRFRARKGRQIELTLTTDLKGEVVRFFYDFFPDACMAGSQLGADKVVLGQDYLILPTPSMVDEFNPEFMRMFHLGPALS